MSDYCLYPSQCGIGTDCSECHQNQIEQLQSELTAAMEENERVRQANLDVMSHYEDARDEAERLRGRVSELERIMREIHRVAKLPPEDMQIATYARCALTEQADELEKGHGST